MANGALMLYLQPNIEKGVLGREVTEQDKERFREEGGLGRVVRGGAEEKGR